MKWPLEAEWALEATFKRRKETRSRDRGDERCGQVQVVAVSPFAWHTGHVCGGSGSPSEERAKGQKHEACSLPAWGFALGGDPGRF